MKKLSPLIFKAFFIAGAGFLLWGYHTHRGTEDFLTRAVEAPGTVVRLERTDDDTYRPVVEYVDREGTKRTLFSRTSSSPPSFFQGETVTVLYDPQDPEFPLHARIKSFFEVWGLTGFLYVFGAIWMLLAGGAWYAQSKGAAKQAP